MRAIGLDIWVQEKPLHLPFFGDIGSRMTVIRLSSGNLLVISPVALSENEHSQLNATGPVQYVVAPNSMHHLSLAPFLRKHSSAQLGGPLKLRRKRPDLNFDFILDEMEKPPWNNDLRAKTIDSEDSICETVFFHPRSRTLIVTDLVFNIQKSESGFTNWIHKLNGSFQKLGMTRTARLLFRNHRKLRQAVVEILSWDFDQIVMAHGEIVQENGKSEFQKSFAWLLERE